MSSSGSNSGEWQSATSRSLLVRAGENDSAAWQRLVSLYSPLVYRWCRQAGLQRADAADVGQEVFQSVARGLASFRHRRPTDTFRGWLRTITKNKIKDWRRRRPGELTGVPGLEQRAGAKSQHYELPEADDSLNQREAQMVVTRALQLIRRDFHERTWRAFEQVTLEGARAREAAERLGMSINAVYMARWRVLHRLREEFADLLEVDF